MKEAKNKLRTFFANPRSDYVLIGIVLLGITIANLVWILAETRPPHWDMGRHLWTSLNYLDLLNNGKLYPLLANYFYYPPIIYLTSLPFYILFGVSVPSAVMSNTVFLTIGSLSMYGIGKRLSGRRTGLLAALFLLCSPMMATQFKEFQVDAPLTAVVALTIYLLIRSREFISTKTSLVLGVAVGLGFLTKWTYGFVIITPLALAGVIALVKAYQEKSLLRIKNIVIFVVSAYVTASIWYVTNLHQIFIDLTQNGVAAGAREGDPLVGSFTSNIWYGWNLLSNQLYIIPFIFLIIGMVCMFVKKENAWKNRYPIALAVGTLLFFTLLRNKDARYTLPAMVGFSVIATYWISQLKEVRLKTAVSLGLVSYLAITFYLVSFDSSFLPNQIVLTKGTLPITAYAQKGYIIGAPSHENWQLEAIFKNVSTMPEGSRKIYYSGPDTIWFNSWDIMYFASRYKVQMVNDQADATIILTRSPQPATGADKVLSLPDGGTLVVKENK